MSVNNSSDNRVSISSSLVMLHSSVSCNLSTVTELKSQAFPTSPRVTQLACPEFLFGLNQADLLSID